MRRWAGPLLGAAVGVVLLVRTWGTWPDVLVDFGGELYVPWRLAEGDVLYRDVAYFTGPLSPYFNAAVFRVFGASFLVLVVANLVVLGGIAVLLHRCIARIAGALAAGVALAVFLALFAFAQLESVGNSNYVCPYSHETTHGALLALCALEALAAWLRTRKPAWIAGLGLLLGLAFLTKVEVFLAVAGAVLLGLALAFRRDRTGLARSGAILLGCAVVPVLVAFAALATAMPAAGALEGTLGAWPYTLGGRVADLAFYRWVLGTDRPAENAAKMAASTGWWIAVFGAAAVAGVLARGNTARKCLVGAVAGGILLVIRPTPVGWIEAGRAFPALVLALLLAWIVAAWRRDVERAVSAAAFGCYALLLLAKMVLHARINMYGFALAMPAAMLLVAALVGWIPERIERAGGSGALFRGFAIAVLAIAVANHLRIQESFLSRKTVVVGAGKDAFRADARGAYVNAAVAAVQSAMRPGATLAVLPEGVMINFLARAKAPARYINYMPPEVIMFGEDRILADFERTPPDLVAIVHKPTAEYGLPWFGADYGARLMAFVGERYMPVGLIGGEPLRPETTFGIRILARK
ncbi:MAG TPA: glycosyltransferase family 39 protein [Planctomycetota bacterium]|jgi:hypothetical protein|nr:glycosyltransferase family 39 protein [Planctomycetota bacterium]